MTLHPRTLIIIPCTLFVALAVTFGVSRQDSDASQAAALRATVDAVPVTAPAHVGPAVVPSTIPAGNIAAGVPAGPVANSDSFSGNDATVIAGNVITNDTGTFDAAVANPVPKWFYIGQNPRPKGTLALGTSGAFSYTPVTGWSGTDTFEYVAQDVTGQTSTATVSFNVTALTRPDFYTTSKNGALNVGIATGFLANDPGTWMTKTSFTSPAHGALSGGIFSNTGAFMYTPSSNFVGTDTFTYTAKDSSGRSSTQTVYIGVGIPAATPTAVADTYHANKGVALTVSAPGVLTNDNGVALTVSRWGTPSSGSIAGNANGSFTFTPAAGFNGSATVLYQVRDSGGQTTTAAAIFTVTPISAAADGYTVAKNGQMSIAGASSSSSVPAVGVLANDTGAGLRVTAWGTPSHGTLTYTETNGAFGYKPATGYTGADIVAYTATDVWGQTATGTVTFTVS